MVCADAQLGGRGRDGRAWFSPPGLGLYATFAFALGERRALHLLSIASGVAVAEALAAWTGEAFSLKWPNDVVAVGRKIAGILCETMIAADTVTCLVGVGINANHVEGDFPPELRARAGSLRMLTGREWPLADGLSMLAAGMDAGLRRLEAGRTAAILRRARRLSRPFLGREIAFHHRGSMWRGRFLGLAVDGGLLLEVDGRKEKIFYSGEMIADGPA